MLRIRLQWRTVTSVVLATGRVHQAYRTSCASNQQRTVPVIIVGAGPTGLTLSILLSRYGIRNVVLDKGHGPTRHPQAHFINNRTMEVFEPLDGLATEIAALSPPLEEWRRFMYCESVTGAILGEVDHFAGRTDAASPDISPVPVAHLPQSRLLPLLLRRATADGSLGSVLYGQHVTRAVQMQHGVQVEVTKAPTASPGDMQSSLAGTGQSPAAAQARILPNSSAATPLQRVSQADKPQQQPSIMQAAYVVACDGAGSGIRQSLGIQMQGPAALQHLINLHFTSRKLGRLALSRRPAMLYFAFNPQVVAVLVAHDLQAGEFVAQVPFFPPLQSPADFGHKQCITLIEAAAGQHLGDVQLLQARPWVMSAQVADSFRSGNILLAGDAAHRFPPAGGFGMNTGIQDAHNLAWKLAMVLQGRADLQSLHSFEAERRPVALANTALSVSNWNEALRIPQALGLDPRAADMLNSVVTAVPLPAALGKGLLEAGLSLGRTLAVQGSGPLSRYRASRLSTILASGDSLRLQFPVEDLGFCYRQGAVAPWKTAAAAVISEQQNGSADPSKKSRADSAKAHLPQPHSTTKSPPRGAPYRPSSEVGCRLPLVWLRPTHPTSELLGRTAEEHHMAALHASGCAQPAGAQQHTATVQESTAQLQHVGSGASLVSTLQLAAAVGCRLLLLCDWHGGVDNVWIKAGQQLNQDGGRTAGPRLNLGGHWLQQQHADTGGQSPLLHMVQILPADPVASADASWHAVHPSIPPKRSVQLDGPRKEPDGTTLSAHADSSSARRPDNSGGVSGQSGSALANYAEGGCGMPLDQPIARFVDVHNAWHSKMGLTLGSVLLVRPDGHVAWRCMGAVTNVTAALAALSQAVEIVMSGHGSL